MKIDEPKTPYQYPVIYNKQFMEKRIKKQGDYSDEEEEEQNEEFKAYFGKGAIIEKSKVINYYQCLLILTQIILLVSKYF